MSLPVKAGVGLPRQEKGSRVVLVPAECTIKSGTCQTGAMLLDGGGKSRYF